MTYAQDVAIRWKALPREERGPKRHLVDLVKAFPFLFADVDKAMAQAADEANGERRGCKPTPYDPMTPRIPVGPGEQRCVKCSVAAVDGRKSCPLHLHEQRMRARIWYQAHKKVKADRNGACFDCNEKPEPGRSRCGRHLEAQAKRDRAKSSEAPA